MPDPRQSEWVGADIDSGMRSMFLTAYRWMADMMIEQGILPPDVSAERWHRMTESSPLYDDNGWNPRPALPLTPIWTWAKWCARNPKTGRLTAHNRPDLRRSEFRDDAQHLDLLHLRVDANRVLLTDLDSYNDILNRMGTPPAQAETWPEPLLDQWIDRHISDPPETITATWRNSICEPRILHGAVEPLNVQGTIWRIEAKDVISVNEKNGSRIDGKEENTIRLSDSAFKDFVEALSEPVPQSAVDLLKRDPEWL